MLNLRIMRLFKRENGIWYIEFERGKKRSLKTKNKSEAIRLYNKVKREYVKGKILPFLEEKVRIYLSEFIEEYLQWAENNRSKETVRKTKYMLNKFQEVIGNVNISTVKKKHLDFYVSYMLAKGLSKTTVNIHIRTIKSVFSKAVEWEYLKENPFKGYKLLKVQQKPPRFLLPDQIKQVEKVIDNEDWLFIFRLFIYTGMRLGEIHNLQWKHIDLNRNIIVVEKTKTFQSRVIPIHPNLKVELKHRLPQVGKVVNYSKDWIEHKLKAYFRKAGFENLRVHDLRHTFASLMVMSGVDLKTVQELLGHTSYKTTEIYAHLAPHHLQDAIKKLPI